MAPLKRKRPPESAEVTGPAPAAGTAAAAAPAAPASAPAPGPASAPAHASDPAAARRATRQTSIAPLPVLPDAAEEQPPRRRRGRPRSIQPPIDTIPHPHPIGRQPRQAQGKENVPTPLEQKQQPKLTRSTRHNAQLSRATPPTSANTSSINPNGIPRATPDPAATVMPVVGMARPPTRAAGLVAGAGTGARAGTGASTRYAGRSDAGPPPPQQQQQQQQQQPLVLAHTVGLTKPITMATSTPQPNHIAAIASASGRTTGRSERGPGEQPDRNIDKVVLGNICFRAWYPSYYGKEVLGDFSGHAGNDTKGGEKEGSKNGSFTANGVGDCKDDASGAKANLRRDSPPMLDRLYVCPSCFKYSKELVTWWEHVSVCERRGFIPGNKIYVHPKGRRTILVPSGPAPKPARGKRGSVGQKMVEEVIQDEGEWSIWEVDGEKDMLFCQNLSLFAKLFLDNKSVFFDVTGFNYFLLVHTPPALPTDPDLEVAEVVQPRGRVVGFFSKEKMSWDNNNLACILIFPPWQRKGLGALLMGISYEISRREGVIGGPEKPISDLGKKGYKRFWAGEIARWILTLETKSAPEETVVDVRECSRATWIAPDDCLLVLKDMGVAEDAGKGPPRVQEPKSEEHEDPEAPEELVQRIRISQRAVLSWVTANRVNLDKPCDPDGFVDGYAMKPPALSEEAS